LEFELAKIPIRGSIGSIDWTVRGWTG
jgi:hypothetical protein